MRYHPHPHLFEGRRDTRVSVRGQPLGGQKFQVSSTAGEFYVLFWYQGVHLAVHVARDHRVWPELFRRFPGLSYDDLELHLLSRREHRKSSCRLVRVRWNETESGSDLTIPGQTFRAVSSTVHVSAAPPAATSDKASDPRDFALQLANYTCRPVEIKLHPYPNAFIRKLFGPQPQRVTVLAKAIHHRAATRTVAHRLFDELNWSHLTFDLIEH